MAILAALTACGSTNEDVGDAAVEPEPSATPTLMNTPTPTPMDTPTPTPAPTPILDARVDDAAEWVNENQDDEDTVCERAKRAADELIAARNADADSPAADRAEEIYGLYAYHCPRRQTYDDAIYDATTSSGE